MQADYDRGAYLESAAKKQAWLKKMLELGKTPQMKVASTIKRADGYWGITKWLFLEEVEKLPGFKIDYYNVRSSEVVLEQDSPYDHPEYGVKVLARKIAEAIDTLQIPSILFDSGGKGLHTHVFFKPPKNEKLLERANRKGVKPKHLRQMIFKMICDEAKIPEEWRGVGKPQDTACVVWDDQGTGKLVRMCGGRKIDKEGNFKGYKTLIDKVPEIKNPVKNFSEVVYPDGNDVKVWTIPESVFTAFLDSFKTYKPRKIKSISPQGTYLNTPCALSLRLNGAPESKRSLGAAVLAHWAVLDNITLEEAIALGEEYYEKCPKDEFDVGEVLQWINFAYNKFYPIKDPENAVGLIVKNCQHAKQIERCDQEHCEIYKKMYGEKKQQPHPQLVRSFVNPQQLNPYYQSPQYYWVDKKRRSRRRSY